MKKKVLSILLVAALALSFTPAAQALGAFADVTDTDAARNVEVLRLMGVLEGDGKGNFRPDSSLTRAEFTKMAVVMTGKRTAVARYASRTVFPDVRGNTWAAGYVNYAASKEAGLIHGMPDGSFAPDRAITYGEAVAILTRLLGYKDADAGGVWPDGYIALAAEAGMTRGLSLAGGATVTRAQAAKLFVNALSSKDDKNEMLLAKLGYTREKEETVLYSVDLANSKLRTKAGDYDLANAMDSTALNGLKGYVLTDSAGKAVTFLPSVSTAGNAVSDAAIIVSADGSTAGFDVLTGEADSYGVFRNGIPTTAAGLKKNDVVIYSAANNAILACDTRVAVYYENCEPSPAAPKTITVLGGTELAVLPTAQQSLSKYKPGENMTVLLTADGRVAGAADSDTANNAYAFVSGGGKVSLICGGSLLELAGKSANTTMDTSDLLGEVARITQRGSNGSSLISLSKQLGVSGNFDPVKMTLGARGVSGSALVFDGDKLTNLAALGKAIIPQGRIAFARANGDGEIDLIVIKDNSGEYYGRVTVQREDSVQTISVDFGRDKGTEVKESYFGVHTGEYVSFRYNSDRTNFAGMAPLTKLSSVPASAWIGDGMVNYDDQTYIVSDQVICYNRDGGSWFDSLAAAKAYGGTLDLYVKDGVVRAIEVRA